VHSPRCGQISTASRFGTAAARDPSAVRVARRPRAPSRSASATARTCCRSLAAAIPGRNFLGVDGPIAPGGTAGPAARARGGSGGSRTCASSVTTRVEVFERQIARTACTRSWCCFRIPGRRSVTTSGRLIQRPFVDLAVSRLAHGGVLRLATDWQPLRARDALDPDGNAGARESRGRRRFRAAVCGTCAPRASSGAASAWATKSGTSPSCAT